VVQTKPLEVYVPESQTGIRFHIWRLVTSPPFENFIMLLIILNTILLMCKVIIPLTGGCGYGSSSHSGSI
jgi:hypothetical protein